MTYYLTILRWISVFLFCYIIWWFFNGTTPEDATDEYIGRDVIIRFFTAVVCLIIILSIRVES